MLSSTLPDVTYVNNQPHFTRPQIMRNVADYAGRDNFNREDALRSFGQLLRDQRIVKLRRGQFAVAEETRFRPENANG